MRNTEHESLAADSFMSPDEAEKDLLSELHRDHRQFMAEHADSMRDAILAHELAICEKFKVLREERGWSQLEVSEKLRDIGFEMHQTTVAKMEKGKRPLRVAEMFALSNVFGMPPAAILHMPVQGDHPGVDYMRNRLAYLDQFIENSRNKFMESMQEHADSYAELVLARDAVIKALKDSAAKDYHGEHPEEA